MKLQEALTRIPPPGSGVGCHQYLMTCANLAVSEGYSEEDAVDLIHASVPEGTRVVSVKEVRDTVLKAIRDHMRGRRVGARPTHGGALRSMRMTTPKMIDRFLHEEENITIEMIHQQSPIVFDLEDYKQHADQTLYHLFNEDDYVFLGEVRSAGLEHIARRDVWRETLQATSPDNFWPQIIWNPLTGRPANKQGSEEKSYRCDNSVASFRYAMVEFDDIPLTQQLRFWAGCRLPVAALVYSGSKSIHGVLKVSGIRDLSDWRQQIQQTLYKRHLVPIGVDPACSNASRMSRFPGAFRKSHNVHQKLLYLNPNATPLYLEL